MRWRIRLSDREHRVEVEKPGQGSELRVTVDGTPIVVDLAEADQGGFSVLVDGRSFTADFERRGEKVALLLSHTEQRLFPLAVEDERLAGSAAAARRTHEGPLPIVAPMPGKVVRVLVKVGDEVKAEQGVLIVEAMKMENELRSPRAGRITEVLVREGAAVEGGQKLCVVS